jgi:hypothetical protein
MPDERHPDTRTEEPTVRYERRDAPLRPVLIILAAAIGFAVIHFWIVSWFMRRSEARQAAIKRSDFPLAASQTRSLPPEPRLEMIDRLENDANIESRLLAQEKALHSYGPTQENGYVRIPIDEAMKRVAGQLPAREERTETRSNGLVDHGAPNSGRMLQRTPPWQER